MIDIKKFLDLNALQKIQDQFSESTGLAAIAVDAEGNYITKPSNFSDFCMKYNRGSEEGLRRCRKCDEEGKGTYFCHAGLMDFSTDIIINGEKVGAILGGQVLPNEPEEEKFRSTAREIGVSEDAYVEALKKVPVRSEQMIRASAQMLGNIVNQLVNLEYIKTITQKRNDVLDLQISNIQRALSEVTEKTRDLQKVASMESILSINASIEAARAGEAGVGFAVVAREFGEISKNSGAVYQRIQELVKEIENSVRNLTEID
ncbi:PocR ligand-binding domain-containing protein [Lacrimispora saccharolytica]|uniref:Methyl-accepting chemotaxis sensory transducer n=1 Tax=Lacrimispora saccharolytica (strain ATCC 35040 / DSM 2544 / NRCC 2533 / WM1) TaxID=610130 RepID=D9RAB0_LACSW|nr:PocR ligand-binding domain-containing protein [Lacrimispora saccharolytica]ADL04188.1 methyl-accepting chemotaxis sensory transducer [[Clostridium] saccharolyticum WM1]QRV21527.1 PocR ligand-binding domain-containing protein [Lacrimispora saccharolytica]